MRGKVLVICPTSQAKVSATNWHDGQITSRYQPFGLSTFCEPAALISFSVCKSVCGPRQAIRLKVWVGFFSRLSTRELRQRYHSATQQLVALPLVYLRPSSLPISRDRTQFHRQRPLERLFRSARHRPERLMPDILRSTCRGGRN